MSDVTDEPADFRLDERTLRRRRPLTGTRPDWSRWNGEHGSRYSVGVEEEFMLLRPSDHSLEQSSDRVLRGLSHDVAEHAARETHAAVIELATGVHQDVPSAVAELTKLRAQLSEELSAMGIAVASAGTYPLEAAHRTEVSGGARYRMVADSMRALARRDPTLALHVHIGVPDAEDAVRLLNGLRTAVPILLALSANSPFCQGEDTGFASARTVIFQGFPRTGTPRRFSDYADYVGAVDPLIKSGALPEPTFLWWDVRLQPALGTVEVRVMDAQTSVSHSAALVALVQSLARLHLEDESAEVNLGVEVLAENRFLAARDGPKARLVDSVARLVPAQDLVQQMLSACLPHASVLGCEDELAQVSRLAVANGADLQRAHVAEHGLDSLLAALEQRFAAAEPASTY
jgi:glutamate---cysteine ligase / carboxylate-amine ligase